MLGVDGAVPGAQTALTALGDGAADVTWADVATGDRPADVEAMVADHGTDVVVLGEDVEEGWSLELCRLLAETRSEVGVVLLRTPSPELWSAAARAGGREVVDPERVDGDLVPAIEAAIERGRRLRQAAVTTDGAGSRTAQVFVVLSPKGGSGKTSVSANLASALAARSEGTVVLADFDPMFGDVATMFGVQPDNTLVDLARTPDFDATAVKVNLTRHPGSGVFLLCAGGVPEEAEAIPGEIPDRLVQILKAEFDYVIVDTAAGLDEWAMIALDHATDLVFVAAMDVASIRNLVAEIDVIDRLGMHHAARHLVVNRADPKSGMTVPDVEKAIGLSAELVVPSSMDIVLAGNSGEPLVAARPRNPVSKAFLRFAERLAQDPGERDEARKRGLGRWGGR